MKTDVMVLLEREIVNELEDLERIQTDEEYTRALNNIAKLHNLYAEERKLLNDTNQKIDDFKEESVFRERELKERIIDRYVKIGLALAELGVPLIFFGVWLHKGFKFEEEGALTSTTFRTLWNNFKPIKR